MGVSMPSTLAGFRALVEAQDLTTAAGQATYAALLQLAPAFADLQAAMNGAKSAADIASERQDLQRQLLELQGNTSAIRALDLANMDQSNRALQQQIWALQDAKAAAEAADQLREAWASVGDSIMDEVKRIRGITDGTGAGSFATLQGEFNALTIAARGGDQDAAGKLVSLSQSLLNAASLSATSKQELDRVKAQTAASLEQTHAIIAALSGTAAAASSSTGTGYRRPWRTAPSWRRPAPPSCNRSGNSHLPRWYAASASRALSIPACSSASASFCFWMSRSFQLASPLPQSRLRFSMSCARPQTLPCAAVR
jgi:hypothetical protein